MRLEVSYVERLCRDFLSRDWVQLLQILVNNSQTDILKCSDLILKCKEVTQVKIFGKSKCYPTRHPSNFDLGNVTDFWRFWSFFLNKGLIISRFYAHWPQSHALTCVSYTFLVIWNKINFKFCLLELPFATFGSQEKVRLRLSEGKMNRGGTF